MASRWQKTRSTLHRTWRALVLLSWPVIFTALIYVSVLYGGLLGRCRSLFAASTAVIVVSVVTHTVLVLLIASDLWTSYVGSRNGKDSSQRHLEVVEWRLSGGEPPMLVGGVVTDDGATAGGSESLISKGSAPKLSRSGSSGDLRPSRCQLLRHSCGVRLLMVLTHFLCFVSGVLMIAMLGFGAWLYERTPVVRDGSLSGMPGLHAPVTITRSDAGVPRIVGSDLHDISYGLGLVHCQERLWQLEFQRRLAQGRLSEVVGANAIDIDILMLTLGVYRAAERAYAALPANGSAVAALQGYADGVNACLKTTSAVSMPLEFIVFGLRPSTLAPWTPVDSLSWSKIMSYDLSEWPTTRWPHSLNCKRLCDSS